MRGHLSKDCTKRITCKLCSKKHPCMLHIDAHDKAHEKVVTKVNKTETVKVPDALSNGTGACTGARDNCVLAIVPIRIRSKKSDRRVEVYSMHLWTQEVLSLSH